MSYLQLDKGVPDFSKAVISLWFRVPQASVTAAAARAAADMAAPVDLPPLSGVIPLLTFGKRVTRKHVGQHNVTFGYKTYAQDIFLTGPCAWVIKTGYPITQNVIGTRWYFTGTEVDNSPSYIGLDCTFRDGVPRLDVRIQMNDYASIDGSSPHVQSISAPPETDSDRVSVFYLPDGSPACSNYPATHPNQSPVPFRTWTQTTTFESGASFTLNCQPEMFSTLTIGNHGYLGMTVPFGQTVTPDHWHHLIVSLDLSTPVYVRGTYSEVSGAHGPGAIFEACKMWISFDDQNLIGNTLSAYWAASLGPNDIITYNGDFCFREVVTRIDASFDDEHGNIVTLLNPGLTAPNYYYTPGPVASADQHLGIPASADFVDHILPVEMAEFQMWTGLTLDTSVAENRRAFVDAVGLPVSPSKLKTAADPQSGSIELLGEKPYILLSGSSSDWAVGRNRGAKLGPNDGGKPVELPADDLDPTGAIVTYSPDPSLHGPQSPAVRPPAH